MVTQYDLVVRAQDRHFRILDDEPAYANVSLAWSAEERDRMLAVAPHVIGVGTTTDGDVPVTVEVHDDGPDALIPAGRRRSSQLVAGQQPWRQLSVASIDVDSGRVIVVGSSTEVDGARRLPVRAGRCSVWLYCWINGYERYLIALYPPAKNR
jgi:hypothetical protein